MRQWRREHGVPERINAGTVKSCEHCGIIFPIDRITRRRRFCSSECKNAATPRTGPLPKHGHAVVGRKSLTYQVWGGMRRRCNDLNDPNYGGRGITVDPSWDDFGVFIADMGEKPDDALTIERRNNDLGYSKANCYWATRLEQGRNKRTNRWIEYDGQTLTLSEWARAYKLYPSTLHSRLQRGLSMYEALHKESSGGRPRPKGTI